MKKIKISLLVILGFLILFGLGIRFVFPKFFLPKIEGQLKIAELEKPVIVVRDRYGVPHIKAQSKKDLFLAFGYVAAQDRLFQMDFMRRTANGELSEIFGERTVRYDKLLRSLRIRSSANETWERMKDHYDPEMLSYVEAYLKGTQKFIDEGVLSLEFSLLSYKPRPFVVQEIMAVPGYMALSFADPIETDPLFSDLSEKLDPKMLDELRLDTKPIPRRKNIKVSFSETLESMQNFLPTFHGSNAWAVSAKRSKSNAPLLANDPHIAFSNPSIWYEAHLSAPGFEVYGYFLPLVPFPVVGQTKETAWTVTMSEVDDLDLYEETFKPGDFKFYKFKNKWLPTKEESSVIKVKGANDILWTVISTQHGPLLNGTFQEVKNKSVAIKWSFLHPKNDIITALYKLNMARSPLEFRDALGYAAAPGLNMIWASRSGDLAQWVMGKIPRRPNKMSSDRILNGESGEDEYLGYLSIEENPHQINPPSGQIVTTNWRPDGEHDLNGFWQPSDRYERIHELLKAKEKWTLEEMKQIQADNFSLPSRNVLPILLASVKATSLLENQALESLKNWDGQAQVESIAATIYYVWNQNNFKTILVNDLGEEGLRRYCRTYCWTFFKKIITDPKSPWWKKSREETLQESFKETISFLQKKFGSDIQHWQWGKLHTLTFEHPLGKVKTLAPLFNLGPYPVAGASNVVNNMAYSRSGENYDVKVGPSTRRLIDLANLGHTISIIPTGNSGNSLSPHYNDQVDTYLKDGYREIDLEHPQEPINKLEMIP